MEWVINESYYNRDVVKCQVWQLKVAKNKSVFLQEQEGFQYTFSFGANSDYSYTGSLRMVKNIETAKLVLESMVRHLRDENQFFKVMVDTGVLVSYRNIYIDVSKNGFTFSTFANRAYVLTPKNRDLSSMDTSVEILDAINEIRSKYAYGIVNLLDNNIFTADFLKELLLAKKDFIMNFDRVEPLLEKLKSNCLIACINESFILPIH